MLTKTAEQRAAGGRARRTSEDSGLIDLKALAVKAESMRPAAMGDGRIVFTRRSALAPAPLGAPVGALGEPRGDAQPKSKLPLIIGGGAGVLVLSSSASSSACASAARRRCRVPTATTVTARRRRRVAPSRDRRRAPTASARLERGPVGLRRGHDADEEGSRRRAEHPGGPGVVAKPAAAAAAAGRHPTPHAHADARSKKSGGDCGCNGDLMCLMKCSTH